jgi:hypothetical protein
MQIGYSELELDSAVTGFRVLSRDGYELGEVSATSLDRACLLVAGPRRLLARGKQQAVHRLAIDEIDPDTMTITTRATRAQVAAAPDFHELDPHSSDQLERYYAELDYRARAGPPSVTL